MQIRVATELDISENFLSHLIQLGPNEILAEFHDVDIRRIRVFDPT